MVREKVHPDVFTAVFKQVSPKRCLCNPGQPKIDKANTPENNCRPYSMSEVRWQKNGLILHAHYESLGDQATYPSKREKLVINKVGFRAADGHVG